MQHEDFGEKIGGAKKDLWKDRGLYVNDLDAMNEREAEKFVKKDNIWKKPDYEAMLEDGIPLGVVYFIKKARDGLNASPQYYRRDDTPEKRLASHVGIYVGNGMMIHCGDPISYANINTSYWQQHFYTFGRLP